MKNSIPEYTDNINIFGNLKLEQMDIEFEYSKNNKTLEECMINILNEKSK